MIPRPFSFLDLYRYDLILMYRDTSLQVHHVENKCEPFTLQSLVSTWGMARGGAVCMSIAGSEGTDLSVNFMSAVSDELCSQLHTGIMKAAHRFMLDEIVSHIILDFLATKKAQKQSKPEAIRLSIETSPPDERMVMVFVCYMRVYFS